MTKQYVLMNDCADAGILAGQLKATDFVPGIILYTPWSRRNRAEYAAKRLRDVFREMTGRDIPVKKADYLRGESSTALSAGKYAPDASQILAVVEPEHLQNATSGFTRDERLKFAEKSAEAHLIEADVPVWAETWENDPECIYANSFTSDKSRLAITYTRRGIFYGPR